MAKLVRTRGQLLGLEWNQIMRHEVDRINLAVVLSQGLLPLSRFFCLPRLLCGTIVVGDCL